MFDLTIERLIEKDTVIAIPCLSSFSILILLQYSLPVSAAIRANESGRRSTLIFADQKSESTERPF